MGCHHQTPSLKDTEIYAEEEAARFREPEQMADVKEVLSSQYDRAGAYINPETMAARTGLHKHKPEPAHSTKK